MLQPTRHRRPSLSFIVVLLLALVALVPGAGVARAASFPVPIKHVFVIVEENHDWADIKGSSTYPYINSLLAQGAHAENYHNVPEGQTLHPSEPNYIMMEAGSALGMQTDDAPSAQNSSASADHLVTYLERAGVSWKSYQEGISGTDCPLQETGLYAPKHNPMVFFQDVTDNNSATSQRCIQHVRPFTELQTDLANNTVAAYDFITPDLCNDMHNDGCESQADTWLSHTIPMIMGSAAYKDNGAIFVTWDEGGSGNQPIGMIVLSPLAKAGYSNTVAYSHASLLRTVEDIFGLQPYLGDAASATDLADFFAGAGAADPGAHGRGTSGQAADVPVPAVARRRGVRARLR